MGGAQIAYVVQPWTASWVIANGCDDPSIDPLPDTFTATQLAINMASRLVSPLVQSELAAITDPGAQRLVRARRRSEINDHGCIGLDKHLDDVTIGSSGQNPYDIQREFNNAGVIETDPNAPTCAPFVNLVPSFVAPSGVSQGDIVAV